jgi:hypothetical protein
MKHEDQHREKGVKAPAIGTEGQEPIKDGSEGPFQSKGEVLFVGHPIEFPVQPPDIEDGPYDQANEKNDK